MWGGWDQKATRAMLVSAGAKGLLGRWGLLERWESRVGEGSRDDLVSQGLLVSKERPARWAIEESKGGRETLDWLGQLA
jgi:hypothetical protein